MLRIAAGVERPRNDMVSGKGRQNGRGRTPPLRIAGESVQRGGGVRSPRPTANMETGRCGHRPLRVHNKEYGESGRRGRRPLRSVTSGAGDREGRPYGGVLLVRWAGRRMRGRMEKQGEPGGSSCFVFCASLYSACFSASSRCGKTWPPFPGLHGRR